MNFDMILASLDPQILAAIISGIFTVLAGLLSVGVYIWQQRKEHTKDFLEWLTQFSTHYQTNENTSRIRIQLAGQRKEILAVLLRELEDDSPFPIPENLAAQLPPTEEFLKEAKGQWTFLKNFTDYLYFFEQILAYGEEMYRSGMKWRASRIVDHFGWFLRSLLMAWPEVDKTSDSEWRDGNAIFARYLAVNRYQRLCEAAVLLSSGTPERKQALYDELKIILESQTGPDRTLKTLEEVETKWLKILGHRGEVKH